MPLQTQQIPSETAAPFSQSSARLTDTAETFDTPQNAAIAELLEAAENAEQKHRLIFRAFLIGAALCFAGWFLNIGTLLLGGPAWTKWLPAILPGFLLLMTVGILLIPSARERLKKVFAELLAFPDEPRLLLPLVDVLPVSLPPDQQTRAAVLLTERLWQLSPSDAVLSLDLTRRATLRKSISAPYTFLPFGKGKLRDASHFDDPTADLAVAVMKTLASIGDKKSVKALKRIIKADAKTPNDTVVRDAAREYLPVLTQKITENEGVQKKLTLCLEEKIRAPQRVLIEFFNTMPPQDAKTALVENLQRRRQKEAQSFPILVINLLAMYFPLYFGLSYSPLLRLVVLCLYTFGAIPLLMFHLFYSMRDDEQCVVYELAQRSETDTRLLPFLLFAARHRLTSQTADMVTKAIARLLPLLQPGDAALVPPAQRAYLRSWLKLPRRKTKRGSGGNKGSNSQTLAILALNALATIGDTKALPAAEAIARRTTRGNYHEADLHEAALRCVDALRMRKG